MVRVRCSPVRLFLVVRLILICEYCILLANEVVILLRELILLIMCRR